MSTRYVVHRNGATHEVVITPKRNGYVVEIDGRPVRVESPRLRSGGMRSLLIEDRSYESAVMTSRDGVDVYVSGDVFHLRVTDELWARAEGSAHAAGTGKEEVLSPMPGEVVQILVEAGQAVQAGETVAVVEAMKMQNDIAAIRGGRVLEIRAQAGAVVDQGAVLVVLDAAEENADG